MQVTYPKIPHKTYRGHQSLERFLNGWLMNKTRNLTMEVEMK
jgi:hypothetical protein